MESLPDDICRQVALLLHCPDVLSVASTNKRFRDQIGRSKILFQLLFCRDTDTPLPQNLENDQGETSFSSESLQSIKRKYLTVAYSNALSSIRWCPALRAARRPDAREGHLMTVLGPPNERVIVTTGGFSDDDTIYSLKLRPAPNGPRCWRPNDFVGRPPSFVYGASLTALDQSRAVRFGGFRAGGYSAETNQVCVLNMTLNENGTRSFRWETPRATITGTPPLARAYHTATLLLDRYLLIVGGMTTRGSIMQCAILDTRTWTWIERPVSVSEDIPSGRHGHSVVLDERRNRLVLFGGGSGSDLLRSGVDNTEVWELSLGRNWKTDLEGSLPWTWSKIYKDQNEQDNNDGDSESEEPNAPSEASEVALPNLSPSESLVLGRCHVGVRVTLDTVLLAFGSGHPSTNRVLGYDLRTDSFLRPSMNLFPTPRFTAASAVLENEGYVIVNGGYSTQQGGAVDDTVVLDLAPALGREFSALEPAPGGDLASHRPIEDSDVTRRVPAADIGSLLARLSAVPQAEREALANEIIHEGISQGTMDLRQAMILTMAANGTLAGFEFGEREDDEDDDDDMSSAS